MKKGWQAVKIGTTTAGLHIYMFARDNNEELHLFPEYEDNNSDKELWDSVNKAKKAAIPPYAPDLSIITYIQS